MPLNTVQRQAHWTPRLLRPTCLWSCCLSTKSHQTSPKEWGFIWFFSVYIPASLLLPYCFMGCSTLYDPSLRAQFGGTCFFFTRCQTPSVEATKPMFNKAGFLARRYQSSRRIVNARLATCAWNRSSSSGSNWLDGSGNRFGCVRPKK